MIHGHRLGNVQSDELSRHYRRSFRFVKAYHASQVPVFRRSSTRRPFCPGFLIHQRLLARRVRLAGQSVHRAFVYER